MKKQFHIRPYDPNRPRKPRSEAQERATQRAFTIARLRGLWYLATPVSEPGRAQIRAIIDHELVVLGAEPQGDRHIREREEVFDRMRERQAADREAEEFAAHERRRLTAPKL